ncbi:MAG: hypothetical protein K2I92_04185 [Muribaculaceae bacterium]|nr:hypothetical protein [Muribaculaceae bacterium]
MKNSSEQIKYAQTAYDAFMKGNNQDWSNFAKLNILRAYHNNGQYKNALKGAIELLNSAEERKDTALITESLVLIGSCRYSLADYLAALDCYLSAYSLDSTIIEQNHVYNIAVAATNINRDSISKDMEDFIEVMSNREGGLPLFKEMANNRRFEEAYHALEHYKNIQDSVIKIIMQNEVSEILDQYDTSKYLLEREKLKNERLSWGIIIILLVAIIVCSVWIYRKQQYNNEREREKLDATLDMLRTDLAQLMVRNDEMATQNRNINKKNALMSSYLRDFLKEKYRKADELCEAYFQDRIIQSKKAKYGKEIETILKDFSNQDFLQEAAKHINQCLDDLYSSFIEDFSNLKEDSRRLFMFLTLGLSTRTICVIFDIETSVFYNRKARLKKMVVESNAKRKEDYLKIITG